MAKYWEENLFPQFLQSVDSVTLLEMTDFEIQNQLGYLVIRSIEDFKFPRMSLEYEFDGDTNSETGQPKGNYFVNDDIGQKEFNVILARMKQYWIEFQISQERMFYNAYYDRHIRMHSPGNTMDKLIKMFTTFKARADRAEFNYGRVSLTGDPAIGDINE